MNLTSNILQYRYVIENRTVQNIETLSEYERAIIYRLGNLRSNKPSGPGVFYVVPCIGKFENIFHYFPLLKVQAKHSLCSLYCKVHNIWAPYYVDHIV